MPVRAQAANGTSANRVLWALIALYAGATFLPLFPGIASWQLIVAAHIIPAALFALIHGGRVYGLRGILVFALLSVVIGNIFENIGVLTGFPFGHYSFTERMGPRLFLVPVLMGPAYLGMGYLSWTLARLILGKDNDQSPLPGSRILTVPLAASFIMVAWDLSMDPALSTIGHYWIWDGGGPYFGVPLTNFLGWYLTNYVIYQSFALYQRKRSTVPDCLPAAYWRPAVLLYAVIAARNILRAISQSGAAMVSDSAGTQWPVSAINGTCALASLFIMGAFALLAWVRISDAHADPTSIENPVMMAKKSAAD